jgi:hypothetical protein
MGYFMEKPTIFLAFHGDVGQQRGDHRGSTTRDARDGRDGRDGQPQVGLFSVC